MSSDEPLWERCGLARHESALEDLLRLIEAYHDYNPSTPAVYPRLPTALEFCKQVSRGLPCVYPAADLINPYKASHWSRSDLIEAVTDTVEVAVTPNGRADSLYDVPGKGPRKVFLQPANINITLKEFFEKLDAAEEHTDGPVYYLQSQNSNLKTTPLKSLFEDLPENFEFAEEVLGEPDAVNIWIGDERSVTTIHRDPYENLYIVLRGTKVFTLWAPVDEVTLDARWFHYGHFEFDKENQTFSIELEKNEDDDHPNTMRWITIDPSLPWEHTVAEHPLYRFARPQKVVVEAGQMLYLPSGWYHYVEQRCGTWDDGTKAPCVSVNYWYDQEYGGDRFVMRELVSQLADQIQNASPWSSDTT